MKVKTLCKCLNITDKTIIRDHHMISDLKKIHSYLLESEHEYFQKSGSNIKEENLVMQIFNQINFVMHKYRNFEPDVKDDYIQLKKYCFGW